MENKQKKTLHLTVKINETGQVLFDADGKFLLGAFRLDGQTAGLCAGGWGQLGDIIEVLEAIEETKNKLFKEYPEIKTIYEIGKAAGLYKDRTITELNGTPFIKSE